MVEYDSGWIIACGLPGKRDEKKAAGYRTPASARLATFSKRAARPSQQAPVRDIQPPSFLIFSAFAMQNTMKFASHYTA